MIVASVVVAVMSMVAMPSMAAESVILPTSMTNAVIDMAVQWQCLSPTAAQWLKDHNGAQQCIDAFMESGYKVSAVVDKLAELSVEAGYYPNVATAKMAMRKQADSARKDEGLWTKFCKAVGL